MDAMFIIKRLKFGSIILVHCTHELMDCRDIFHDQEVCMSDILHM